MTGTSSKNNLFCQEITERIINEKTGIFDEVFTEFVNNFIHNLNTNLEEIESRSEFQINKEKILVSAGREFKHTLINVCKKTLISEIYNGKAELKGENSKERYEYFIKEHVRKRYNEIFAEGTVLKHIINTLIKKRTEFVLEFFHRLTEDYEKIKDVFFITSDRVTDLTFDCGDTHNGGKAVIIVHFNEDKKILYKPHSLKNDEIFNKFIDFVNSKEVLKCRLACAQIFDCGDYGWQEFINSEDCKDIMEVKNCMYRFGTLICIAYLFNSVDLHFENVIVSGENPYIVDMETLIHNNSINFSRVHNEIDGFVKLIFDSVYTSMLLIQNHDFNRYPMEMSGIGGGYCSEEKLTINTVINAGTDNIQYGEVKVNFFESQKFNNIVKINGEKVNLTEFTDDIIVGFKDMYNFIIENKKEIEEFINNTAFWGEYRQVLRATSTYAKFLEASYHPLYLKSHDTRKRVFECLRNSKIECEEHEYFVGLEIEQLLEEDVPYFYTKYNSKDLYTFNGKCINNFYSKTLEQLLADRINKFSKRDLEIQCIFIKAAMASTQRLNDYNDYRRANSYLDIKESDGCNEITSRELAKSIGDYIDEYYSYNNNYQGTKFFYNIDESDGYKIKTVKPILYDGVGIALLYLYLYTEFKDEKYRETFTLIMKTLNSYKPDYFRNNIGAFEGLTSLLYLNYNAAKVLDSIEYYDNYNVIADYILNINMDDVKEFDIISGLSGVIITVLNIYKKSQCEVKMLNIARKCGERLFELITKSNVDFKTGFAHGMAGISTALIYLSSFIEEEKYYNEGINLIVKENNYYSKNENNWLDLRNINETPRVFWCYGAAGILESRQLVYLYLKEKDKKLIQRDIENCIKKVKESIFKDNLQFNLCHGSIGNLDVLLSKAIEDKDEELADFVRESSKKIIKDLITFGWRCDNPTGVTNIDFMTGISGTAYFLLRLNNFNIPSVLSLESF